MMNKLKMRKIQFSTVFLIGIGFYAGAQTKGLQVGGEFRNLIIPKVLNGNQRSLNTSSFKDKLLIIDFWATTCSGCVAALPKMQALQKQFNQQLKIIPVTYEDEALVAAFWKKNKYTRTLHIPVAVGDTKINALFPHEVIPHEIWIYKGKVIGITSEEYVDEFNIRQVLSGKIPNWPVKDDYYMFDAQHTPVFVPDEKQINLASTQITYAGTSGYMEKDGASAAGPFGNSGMVRDSVRKTIRTYYINQSILNIYLDNWNKLASITSLKRPAFIMTANQIVWDVIDPVKYMYRTDFTPMVKASYTQDWKRDHAICFEAQYADTGQTDKEVAKKAIKDLNWLLGLNVRWEKRKEKVMIVTGDKMSVSDLVSQLNAQPGNPYVFNETKKGVGAELQLNISSRTDLPAVRKALQQNGMDLKEEERMVDKFVFSEVGGGLIVDGKMSRIAMAQIKSQENMPVPTAEEGKQFLQRNNKKPGVTTLPSGLQYEVLKAGKGPRPGLNDKVVVHFTGKFVNGKIFDSSYQGGLPFATRVTELISGWTEALQLMPVGSKWSIYLPSELAYGDAGGVNIPPGSTLVFDMELIRIL